MDAIKHDIRLLKLYAVATSALCAVLLLSGFDDPVQHQRFEEIDVERINIVEADGTLRMVIANEARQHPGIANGEVIERSGPRPPGLLFFNQHGDEMGGLVFGPNGERGHFGSLTWDKVGNDQTIGFRHLEGDNGAYSTGLEMWQQPNIPVQQMIAQYEEASGIADTAARRQAVQELRQRGELTARRLFFGKGRNDAMLLDMRDAQGRTRILMSVAPDGTPTLEFRDTLGTVIARLPQD